MEQVVNLSKGGVVNLSKKVPGLTDIRVGLGWDEAKAATKPKGFFSALFGSGSQSEPVDSIDCDAFVLLLTNGRLRSDSDIVFFNNKKHRSGCVQHHGDNLVGGSGVRGDDEQITINLSRLPSEYDEIVTAVNIYQAYQKRQNFGKIDNSFIRLVDLKTNQEICRYNISESPEFADKTCVLMGSLKKNNGEWEFKAVGEGYRVSNISEFAGRYR